VNDKAAPNRGGENKPKKRKKVQKGPRTKGRVKKAVGSWKGKSEKRIKWLSSGEAEKRQDRTRSGPEEEWQPPQ